MKIRRGSAAVTGNESRMNVTILGDGKARQLGRSRSQKTCPLWKSDSSASREIGIAAKISTIIEMKNGILEFNGKGVKGEKMRVDAEKRKVISSNVVLGFLLYAGIAFALLIIVYGMDFIAPGAHDTFHDFRHVIGMPCH